MNVLLIGQGGREHALVKVLIESSLVDQVHVISGSDGIAQVVLCHDIDWRDEEKLLGVIERNGISLVVVGPEKPLVYGVADQLREKGILVFGPSKQAAQLEGSKIFAKEFMKKAECPTAPFKVVTKVEEVKAFYKEFTPPYVLKADGLAGGKGVVICQTPEELFKKAEDFFVNNRFGKAGQRALLEQFEEGWELSFHILTNGTSWEAIPLAQDHKRLGDGDKGPNTGGMGTVAPLKIEDSLHKKIQSQIIAPVLKEMKKNQMLYRGVLYIGLMITADGPKVIEFNCRFGDPEAQVMLPLLQGDWGEVLKSIATGEVLPLSWYSLHTACVVLAAPGYPDHPEKGLEISGDSLATTSSSYFLHAGTYRRQNQWFTNGGRVLNAIGIGSTKKEALDNAYKLANTVSWKGLQVRSDIGCSPTELSCSK